MKKGAFTLIELMVAILLLVGLLLVISESTVFMVTQIKANLEKSDILSQVNYCLEDVKLRCVSATELNNYFIPKVGNDTRKEFIFRGESDIYTVTPDEDADNVWYRYYVRTDNNLVLMTCTTSACDSGTQEVLIEGRYAPQISFIYEKDSSPETLKVQVSATNTNFPLGSQPNITKEAGIRFWFIDIAQ